MNGIWLGYTDFFGTGHEIEDVIYGKDEQTAEQRFRVRFMLPDSATVIVQPLRRSV